MLNFTLFNWLDWVIVAVVGLSMALSLWRGFVREAMSLAGWVAAFVLANLFSDLVAEALAPYVSNVGARHVAAYILLFVAVLILANLCSFLLKQLVWMTGLTVLDRILGTVFGFARGVLVVLVAVLLARELLAPEHLEAVHRSQLMPHLDLLVQWVEAIFGDLDFGWVPGISSGFSI